MDDCSLLARPVSLHTEDLRSDATRDHIFSPCLDAAPPDLLDSLNSIFSGDDPAAAATACLRIIIADHAWSSPPTIAAWFDNLADPAAHPNSLPLLGVAFSRIPADWDFADFSPNWVSALLSLFPDARAIAILSSLISRSSDAFDAFLAALGPDGARWDAFIALFHRLLDATPEGALDLLAAVVSHRRSVARLLLLLFEFADNFGNFSVERQIFVIQALAHFCRRDSAVSGLLVDRDSIHAVFAAIGECEALLLPGLELAWEITRVYDRNLFFLKKTGLVDILCAAVPRMDSPAIALSCRILRAAVETGQRRASLHFVRSGILLELNCYRDRFSFAALEAFVLLISFCCHYGATECVERIVAMDVIGAIVAVFEGLEEGAVRKQKWIRRGLSAIAGLLEEQGRMDAEGEAVFGVEGLAILEESD